MTNDQFLKQLGSKIRSIRLAQKLSLQRLSRRCDMDYSALWKIERGRSNVRVLTIITIAEGLGVELKDLI